MRIDPNKHGWMTAPETLSVFAALGAARFVGGAVRNALLGAAVIDIDIAVPLPPLEAMNRLQDAGIKVVPTGLDHGTVTAIRNEDSARRDFTMNALYAGLDGEIFDYHGGVEDLIAGRVRFVGEPSARIREDHLRILRLFRFHAWYGKGDMDGEALRAAANAKTDIAKLSGERIAKELLRLLECPNPVPVLRVMAAAAILPEVLPGALQPARLEHLVLIDAENDFPPDSVLRLAALLPDEGEAVRAVGERLKLSNADRARLVDAVAVGTRSNSPSPLEVRKLLYRVGVARFRDWVLLRWAAGAKGAGAIQGRMLLSVADSWRRPKFPLTGQDVMTSGVPEGPAVGRVLQALEEWWMDKDFPDDAPALSAKLKAIVQAGEF